MSIGERTPLVVPHFSLLPGSWAPAHMPHVLLKLRGLGFGPRAHVRASSLSEVLNHHATEGPRRHSGWGAVLHLSNPSFGSPCSQQGTPTHTPGGSRQRARQTDMGCTFPGSGTRPSELLSSCPSKQPTDLTDNRTVTKGLLRRVTSQRQ